MNVLYVSALFPYPLHSGGQVRIYNLLKCLSRKHTITLAAFIRNEKEKELRSNLNFCKDVRFFYRGKRFRPVYILRFLNGQSLLTASYTHSDMYDYINEAVTRKEFDLIHIEPFYVFLSVPKTPIPLIVSEHNVEYEVYEKYASTLREPFAALMRTEAKRIRNTERECMKRADLIVTVSQSDKSTLSSIVPHTPITVVPNGVDTRYFQYKSGKRTDNDFTFLFTGNMLWLPNRNAAEKIQSSIWPRIRQILPHAKLRIVGKGIRSRISQKDGVSWEGNVEDIRSVYGSCNVLLAPMEIAGGTKFKMLEAMASGLPIITTKEGIAGLTLEHKKHAFIAENDDQVVQWAVYCTKHEKEIAEMTHQARQYVVHNYDWNTIAGILNTVWENAV